jgi:hypothetical protein
MLSTDLLVVVNLAVGGDRNLAIFREKRLGARKWIDDGQTLMRQAHLSNDRKESSKIKRIDYEARLAMASFVLQDDVTTKQLSTHQPLRSMLQMETAPVRAPMTQALLKFQELRPKLSLAPVVAKARKNTTHDYSFEMLNA